MQDEIISTLLGLVGACNNNPKTNTTDRLVLEALAYPSCHCTKEELVAKLRAEKYTVSPNCATCAMPCGNTSDYDMSRIYSAETEVRKAKLTLLQVLREIAVAVTKNDVVLSDEDIYFIYKALSYVGYDLSAEILLDVCAESQVIKSKIEGN